MYTTFVRLQGFSRKRRKLNEDASRPYVNVCHAIQSVNKYPIFADDPICTPSRPHSALFYKDLCVLRHLPLMNDNDTNIIAYLANQD
ncbi:hypothetical protein BD560DRAFT_441815 [Blakeslea trispora]|nr:hypothetical protein BD560DRAFT_441815 [Blakeslea trispora]